MNDNTTPSQSRKSTILIVEDNLSNLRVLTNCLKQRNYKTPVAQNGETALQRAKRIRPDLILLDVMLPGINGFEICRRLKADALTRDIPVIFMTALTGLEDKLKGFQAGAVDYITKPIQHEEVFARVSTHLRIQEQAAALTQANAEICDLNERLKVENVRISGDLRESEYRYRTLVEEMTDGYCVIRDEHVIFANSTFCHMHGYQLEDIIGQPFARFVAEESRQKIIEMYAKNHQNMFMSHVFEYLRLTKDGSRFPTEMTTKTAHYESTVVDIGICRDISERIELEKRIRAAERMAYVGKITTSLSHEIRNPLSAIKMNLQILKKIHHFDADDVEHLDISIQEVMRLEGISNELLNFAKPLHLKYSQCQINQIISSCLTLLRVDSEKKQIAVISDFDQKIPAIQADEKKLVQVFLNILLNAFEVSEPEGTIRITSRYCQDTKHAGVEVEIEDEGAGIPKQQVQEIFEPFFTTKPQGTGLGLTNVKQIVEAHHGKVEAANRHPRGAVFRVWLPVENDSDFSNS